MEGACQGIRPCQGGLTGDPRARVPTVVSSQGLHRQREMEPGCFLTVIREGDGLGMAEAAMGGGSSTNHSWVGDTGRKLEAVNLSIKTHKQ